MKVGVFFRFAVNIFFGNSSLKCPIGNLIPLVCALHILILANFTMNKFMNDYRNVYFVHLNIRNKRCAQ